MFQIPHTFGALRELDALANEFGRALFADGAPFHRFQAETSPAMNVWENEDGVVVKADLPGMDVESLDVSVDGDVLTIGGTFGDEESAGENAKFHRRERTNGEFKRDVQLPYTVDGTSADAVYEKGVLTIKLDRPEELKPKKITVQAI